MTKILLFRFEAEKIHYLECEINSWILSLWEKNKISLDNFESRWDKYNKIIEIIWDLQEKYSADIVSYQSPQKYRGVVKDEEWYANGAILELFSAQNNIHLEELTPQIVRKQLGTSAKDFKSDIEAEKLKLTSDFKITKSDKLIDGFIYVSLLKNILNK